MYSENDWWTYLSHHGIKGQKWGVQNGPPYPLDAGDHSSSERKAGWKSSLNKSSSSDDVFRRASNMKLNAAHQKYGSAALTIMAAKIAVPLVIGGVTYAIQDAKNKKEDKLYYEERANKKQGEERDPNTGFYLKNRKYSREEDIAAVNPDFSHGGYGASNNCMLCSVTYDLRRRGYDVEARKMSGNGCTSNQLKAWYKNPEINTVSTRNPETGKRAGWNDNFRTFMVTNAKNELLAQGSDGVRGNIMVQWISGGGHSMVYEVNHGKLEIIDTQSGDIYRGSQIDNLLNYTNDIKYARTDNLEIKEKNVKGVAR